MKRKIKGDTPSKSELAAEDQAADLEEAFSFFSQLHEDDPKIVASNAAIVGLNKPEDGSSDDNSDDDDDSNEKASSTKKEKKKEKKEKEKVKSLKDEKKKSKKVSKEQDLDIIEDKAEKKKSKKSKKETEAEEPDEEVKKSIKKRKSKDSEDVEEDSLKKEKKTSKKKNKKEEVEIVIEKTEKDSDNSDSESDSSNDNDNQTNQKVYPRGKAPPDGYVCNACKSGGHWIFDCSKYIELKKTSKKNTKVTSDATNDDSNTQKIAEPKNKKTKFDSSENNEDVDKTKIFVQGLPFNITHSKLNSFFETNAGPVKTINLISFEDSKRCKGMAYVIFNDVESASIAVNKLNKEKMGERWLDISYAKIKMDAKYHTQPSAFHSGGGGGAAGRCFRCGGRGHTPQTCTKKRMCYRCKSTDHISSECPTKK